MEDKKLSGENGLKFSDLGKWLDNIWYHYKGRIIIIGVAVITVIVCMTQFVSRETYDYHMLYAGPQVVMLQDINYMEAAVEDLGEDRDGNGEVSVSIADIVMLSPEEQKLASEAGASLNGEVLYTSMKEYEQQIMGGDAVICLLSPYMYEIVHSANGFIPLSEIFEEIPESAYDDCAIVLSETQFGKHYNGMNDLPKDTLLCIRRLSSFAQFKGEAATRAEHEASVELFKRMVAFGTK